MPLIASNSLDEIYETLDRAKQYDGYVVAACPFHDDFRPSFFVYPDWYKCMSCGANGPTSKLLSRLGKVPRAANPRARNQTTTSDNPFTGWLRYRTLKGTLKLAWQHLNNHPDQASYLYERGIDEPYRRKLKIGYLDDWYTIPIIDRNGIIVSATARKGRDNESTSKYVLPNGTDPHLLYIPNRKRVRNANYLIVTFGILDAITLAIMGYPSASTISGKRVNKASFSRFRIPILLIPDRKEEQDGLIAAQKLGWRGHNIRMEWPDGCNDVNDIWVKDRALCKELFKEIASGIN